MFPIFTVSHICCIHCPSLVKSQSRHESYVYNIYSFTSIIRDIIVASIICTYYNLYKVCRSRLCPADFAEQ
jgi:hypothetical protein